jgi:choline dehydrogenase
MRKTEMITTPDETTLAAAQFTQRVHRNQLALGSDLRSQYDFIVCGSGSSGSVVARRLAENQDVSVLLLEAGRDDDVPEVMRAERWPANLGSERDWGFHTAPSSHLNGRSIPYPMGKVLGGGSSINVMAWARGHKNDWNFFACQAGDKAWSHESVLDIYRRIEDWHGAPDPDYRGTGGPVYVEPAPDPNPIAPAALEGARSVGIPTFENQNGRMTEAAGGASIIDLIARNGYRQSVFRSYVFPYMDRPNLTVLTGALVTRVTFDDARATGVEFSRDGTMHRVGAGSEVVLSLGAIHTPKVLMQSGIGDYADLHRFGIPVIQHLPGVGQNLQDHPAFGSVWEYQQPLAPRNNGGEATWSWKSHHSLDTPDLQASQLEVPYSSPEAAARFTLPEFGWTLLGAVVRPKSRGHISLTGPHPTDPVHIQPNMLSHHDDMTAAMAAVQMCREIGNSPALRPSSKREAMPGNLKGAELERFIRDAASTHHHKAAPPRWAGTPCRWSTAR